MNLSTKLNKLNKLKSNDLEKKRRQLSVSATRTINKQITKIVVDFN